MQVEGNRKPIQHLEGGIVARFWLPMETISLQINRCFNSTSLSYWQSRILFGRLWAKRATVDRLLSERDDLDKVTFDADLLAVLISGLNRNHK